MMATSVPQNIAILDPSAWLVGFVRMDNAFLGSIVSSPKFLTSQPLHPNRRPHPFPSQTLPVLTLGGQDIAQKKAKTVVFYNGIPSDAIKQRSEPGGDIYAIQETNGGTVV